MRASWVEGGTNAPCPLCRHPGEHRLVVEVASARYARCAECGCVFAPDARAPAYEDTSLAAELTSYYVEHLAAIDTIVDPLFTFDPATIRHYAEIGCSFGFAPDLARHAFGWDVRGIDPSALARSGARLLGLPIRARYFSEAEPLGDPPADLLVASEVLEHFDDPHALMRAVAASTAARGIIVLSTPNAAAVRPDMDPARLAQVLCPGYHLVIFSAAGLRRLVEAHGFTHHHVRETPTGLSIFAARVPFAWRADGATDRETYRRYLFHRLDGAPAGSALACGMLFRLMREFTIHKMWSDAEALLPRLVETYRTRKIDLTDPAGCRPDLAPDMPFYAFARRYPLNLGGVFYALGLLAMLRRHDNAAAVACFDASAAWYRALRRVTAGFGMVDAESEQFERRARAHATVMAGRHAPDAALARFSAMPEESGPDDADARSDCRERLFIELVNGGHLAWAETLAADVAEVSRERDMLNTVRLYLALGILALNHRGDRPAARAWFRRALAHAPAGGHDPELAPFLAAAAAALRVAEAAG